MGLDDYQEPKGTYYNSAWVAQFSDSAAAEQAVSAVRGLGLTERDIQVRREDDGVLIVVSSSDGGLLNDARRVLQESGATEVRQYGSGGS